MAAIEGLMYGRIMPTRAPAGPTEAIGSSETLGVYAKVSRLAVGGMAEVWLAEAPAGRGGGRVVLKAALDDPHGIARRQLGNEALILDMLPIGVAPQLLDELDGVLVLEHLEGVTLEGLLAHLRRRGKRLKPSACAALIGSLGEHLAALNSLGVVHSDLSPANVFVTRGGDVRLLDFGLATTEPGARDDLMLRGTPEYMAPEQLRGEPATAGTDLFAVGLCVYEALTGAAALPPGTRGLSELLQARSGLPAPPSSVNARLPKEVDAILLGALSPDTAGRPSAPATWSSDLAGALGAPADAAALATAAGKAAVSRAAATAPVSSRTLGRPLPAAGAARTASWPARAAFVLVVGVLGAAWFALDSVAPEDRTSPTPAPAGASIAPLAVPDAPSVRSVPDTLTPASDVAVSDSSMASTDGGGPNPSARARPKPAPPARPSNLKLVVSSVSGALYVSHGKTGGPAPRTISPLREGGTSLKLRGSTLSVRVRVTRNGRRVSATASAARGTAVTAQCGGRTGQLPMSFGVRPAVKCVLKTATGRLAFKLRLVQG